MDLLILCGGYATRLRPITEKIPKILVEINGRPFIDYLLMTYERHFDRIFLLAGFLGEKLKKYETNRIKVIIEPEKLDTGGAILNALPYVSDEFVVVNGDTIVEPADLDGFIGFSRDRDAVIYVVRDESNEKGTVIVDEANKVLSFNEKETSGKHLVYAGICYMKRKVLKEYKLQKISLEREIFPSLVKEGVLYAYKMTGKIYDIGTPAGLKEFEAFAKRQLF